MLPFTVIQMISNKLLLYFLKLGSGVKIAQVWGKLPKLVLKRTQATAPSVPSIPALCGPPLSIADIPQSVLALGED